MSDGGGTTSSLGHRAPARVLALILATLLALAGGTAAVAAPTAQTAPNAALAAKAKALQAKLDTQHAEVERLAERLNATEDRRRRLQASLRRLETRRKAAEAELGKAQAQLDEQARATYMGGPQWLLGELVGGANPPDAMRRLPMQKAAVEARAAVVTEVRVRKAEVDSLNERVAADLAEAEVVHRRQDDERRQVQRLVEQLQSTLDKIDEQLAGYLEAERDRSEASRRAAWSGYMSGVGTVQSWLQAGPVARAAVRWALAQLGDPYQWGATGPDRFDCSGLTSSAYRAAGVGIPRVSRAQWGAGPHVAVSNLLPGDLVFYADNPRDPATIHHVGMYIGNGLMVHAPHTGDVVRVASIWRQSYAGATRIVPGVITPGLPGPPPTAPPPTSPTPPTPPPMTTAPTTTAPPTTRAPTTTAPGSSTTTTGTTTT
ncbi:MAG TPA: NlpC/P60 family protein, partial [Actinomycetota bacterium]|nr:NlpC/P60 family protein [Actinomycetota bacterium]